MKVIALTKGYEATVDDEDFPLVSDKKWCVQTMKRPNRDPLTYAVARFGKKMKYMHRILLGEPRGKVDHQDGNGLNNTRGNLRRCTNQQNIANGSKTARRCASQYKGVSRIALGVRRWQARIIVAQRSHYIGKFHEEFDAATAYNFAAEHFFGDFARYNLSSEESA